MEATPVAHNAEGYRGFALAQLRILSDYCKRYNLNIASRKVELSNGVVVVCQVCYNKEDVWVKLPPVVGTAEIASEVTISGFIFHPRSGEIIASNYFEYLRDEFCGVYFETHIAYGVHGGWENGVTPLLTNYIFPLVDPDNASLLMQSSKGRFLKSSGNYGNLYWTGPVNTDKPEETVILSWKGAPSRHGEVPQSYYIPGLSDQETVIPGAFDDLPEYTVFGPSLYAKGVKIADAPMFSWPYTGATRSLILGAMQDVDGAKYIVTQNDHNGAPTYIWCFSDGAVRYGETDDVATNYLAEKNNVIPQPRPIVSVVKKLELTRPGYFVALWTDSFSVGSAFRTDGWELLLEVQQTRVELPWFGNESGNNIVCGNGAEFSIMKEVDPPRYTATYTAKPVPVSGTTSQTLANGSDRYEVAYSTACSSYNKLFEYQHDIKKAAVASLTFSASSVQNGGYWGGSEYLAGATGQGANLQYILFPKKIESFSSTSYIHMTETSTAEDLTTLPRSTGNYGLSVWDWIPPGGLSEQRYIGVDTNQQPMPQPNKGIARAVRFEGSVQNWVGEFPGTEHEIRTDFSVQVCGVTIPIVRTTRDWKDERQVYSDESALEKGMFFLNVTEDCVIEKSTIHFLDQRYGVCLYRTVKDEIHMAVSGDDVTHSLSYGAWQISNTAIVTVDSYTATSNETWHLVIDGVDTVIASAELELIPFGEPLGTGSDYEGYVRLLCFPKLPASSFIPEAEPASVLGCYEDGYDDPYGEQAQADGGIDHFYPEWCRVLEEDPFWKAAASSRFSFTAPGATYQPAGIGPYTPPEVAVEPMPIGSFARHPKLGDMYQFLLDKFTGERVVISSSNINSFIDAALPEGQATHDTTLYYPISLY